MSRWRVPTLLALATMLAAVPTQAATVREPHVQVTATPQRADTQALRPEPVARRNVTGATRSVEGLVASSGAGLDLSDPLVQDAMRYASNQGIDIHEAVRRMRLQESAGDLSGALEADEAETFAGLWIQHEPEYAVVASFTRGGEDVVRRHVEASDPLADEIDVRTGVRTLADLRQLQQRSMDLLDRLGVEAEHGVDVAASRVETYVKNVPEVRARLDADRLSLPQDVVLVPVDDFGTPEANIYAGLQIKCTSGTPCGTPPRKRPA